MAEPKRDGEWVDSLLRRELHRVPAPPKLWDRVSLPRLDDAQSYVPQPRIGIWAVASVFAGCVMAVAWASYPARTTMMRSTDVSAVRSWVFQQTGMNLPLASPMSPSITIDTATVSERGIVEISYHARKDEARLVIERSTAASQNSHAFIRNGGLERSVSWTANGYHYTLGVKDGNVREACVICHAGSDSRTS